MAKIAAIKEAVQAGKEILQAVPSLVETTQKIFQAFDGATEFKDRTRSLELVIVNGSKYTLKFANEYFGSGTWFVSPDPLVIPPGEMSLLFVANKQGGILTGVTGGLEYKLADTEYCLYVGFHNPYAGSYKNFIAIDDKQSAEWAYKNAEDDKVKQVTSHGFKMTCTTWLPKVSPYKRFEYAITEA